jgi:hypothetical protein
MVISLLLGSFYRSSLMICIVLLFKKLDQNCQLTSWQSHTSAPIVTLEQVPLVTLAYSRRGKAV